MAEFSVVVGWFVESGEGRKRSVDVLWAEKEERERKKRKRLCVLCDCVAVIVLRS